MHDTINPLPIAMYVGGLAIVPATLLFLATSRVLGSIPLSRRIAMSLLVATGVVGLGVGAVLLSLLSGEETTGLLAAGPIMLALPAIIARALTKAPWGRCGLFAVISFVVMSAAALLFRHL